MKSLGRYSKKIVSLVIAVMALTIGICSFSFKSSAAGTSASYEFYVNYSEPSSDGYNGYINVMYQAGGGYRLYTYFWVVQLVGDAAYETNESIQMVVRVRADELYIAPVYNLSTGANVTLACYDWNDDLHILGTHYLPAGNNNFSILEEDYSAAPIYGYNFKNCIISTSSGLMDVPIPEIYWNNSVDSYWLDQELNAILSALGNIDADTSTIISRLENIYNQNVVTNQKLDELKQLAEQIKAEQEESNTWLEKIWNSLQEFLGLEGEESTEDLKGKEESKELTEEEDKLLNDDDVSTDDLKLDLDANSSGIVWARVEEIVTAHETLFTTIISLLTLGVVALILNR